MTDNRELSSFHLVKPTTVADKPTTVADPCFLLVVDDSAIATTTNSLVRSRVIRGAPFTLCSRCWRLTRSLPGLHITLPPSFLAAATRSIELSVLPSLSIRSLRTKISKAIGGVSVPKTLYRMVAILSKADQDEALEVDEDEEMRVDIPADQEARPLDHWGLEDGDEIRVVDM